MADHEQAAGRQHRELIAVATGILMARYEVTAVTAESALMDWSRITGVDVPELARRLVADSERRRPEPEI